MAHDALDPGEDGTYPYFPRRTDGSPYWSDSAETDGIPLAGPDGIPRPPMPRGLRTIFRDGQHIIVDVTPRTDGAPVSPPPLL